MNLKSGHTALIVIDVQQALADPAVGDLYHPQAERNISKIMERWRQEKLPLFLVQYLSPRPASPFHRDAPGSELKTAVRPLPGEILIIKHFESAFMKTGLENRLREQKIDTLLFVGFYTDQCVAASAKVANNLGFLVYVVADATGTAGCRGYNGEFYLAEDIQQLSLGSLQRDGISIIETSSLLAYF